jgi:hypothetical protein
MLLRVRAHRTRYGLETDSNGSADVLKVNHNYKHKSIELYIVINGRTFCNRVLCRSPLTSPRELLLPC